MTAVCRSIAEKGRKRACAARLLLKLADEYLALYIRLSTSQQGILYLRASGGPESADHAVADRGRAAGSKTRRQLGSAMEGLTPHFAFRRQHSRH